LYLTSDIQIRSTGRTFSAGYDRCAAALEIRCRDAHPSEGDKPKVYLFFSKNTLAAERAMLRHCSVPKSFLSNVG
jgi:hypothetical protein